jgi:hypothetical protein
MGQFKPMVKMETTEPSVELKLAKGGAVKMKKGGSATKKMAMGGGSMDMMMGTPALVGRPAVNAPVRAPGKPSMASRRRAMMPKKPMAAPPMPPMKKGGKAEGGESKGMHKAEMKAIEGVDSKLSKHASMAASKGHKGLKTGGVALGNAGGFKTGGVAMGNAGGFKTGGVTMGNAGGFKHGGKSSKKAYATGGTVNSGRPVAMPQGNKKPSAPVSIDRLSGTFKKGGSVTPAEGRLQKNFGAENKTAMKQAKAQSNEVYSKYQKMQSGGAASGQGAVTDRERKMMNESFFDKNKVDPKSVSDKASRELEEAMNPLSMVKELAGKARDYFMPKKTADSVTKTKESVTVTPAGKKRGGVAC